MHSSNNENFWLHTKKITPRRNAAGNIPGGGMLRRRIGKLSACAQLHPLRISWRHTKLGHQAGQLRTNALCQQFRHAHLRQQELDTMPHRQLHVGALADGRRKHVAHLCRRIGGIRLLPQRPRPGTLRL